MKYVYTLLFAILLAFSLIKAQVPNGGFENWTAGEPDFWTTNNDDTLITITQSNSSHSGSFALKGEAINYLPPFLPVMGPILFCEGANGDGFPINARYNSLKGFFKFNPQGGDQLYISVYLSQDTVGIGAGAIVLNGAASYTEFGVPIVLINPGTPNLCYIVIEMLNPNGGIVATLGSEMYLDDIELSMDIVSDVEDEFQPLTFQLEQNYPNPFNPSTTIRYAIPNESKVSITVFNSLGQEVATLVNDIQTAGYHEVKFNAYKLSSGVYYYRINAISSIDSKEFSSTKKFILLK
ncbi:MAG: T9SS type A sorting domain-containing protein [Ignavibacteriota bacterium]